MYNVPEYTPKIRLRKNTGECWEYKNIQTAAKELYHLGYIQRYSWRNDDIIGNSFNEIRLYINACEPVYVEYIVETEFGDIILVSELKKYIPKNYNIFGEVDHTYYYRRDSVPHIHKSRGKYRGYRRPKTTAERRASMDLLFDEDAREYNIRPRAARNHINLINAWDDIPRHYTRSWKKHRRHQWKNK